MALKNRELNQLRFKRVLSWRGRSLLKKYTHINDVVITTQSIPSTVERIEVYL